MRLEEYQRKRRFNRTPEPRGGTRAAAGGRFVIQKHSARRLHYDFRLELGGVLKSWAVPKGPSLDPGERRLAVHVEDHPLEYGDFEGVIPPGEYGAGTVLIWDRGSWLPEGDPAAAYEKGHLRFRLNGQRLRGGFSLVRMGARDAEGKENWLLIKADDAWANPGRDPLAEEASVITGRHLEEIAASADRVWDAVQGERAPPARRAAAFPTELTPELATLVEQPPEGDHWVNEIKLDGYRALTRIERGRITLLSRNGLDWTDRFRAVAQAMRALKLRNGWLDGEVAVLGRDGRTRFGALQQALAAKRDDELVYFLFDLLWADGEDLRELPLLERKARLAARLAQLPAPSPLRFCDHLQGRGAEFLAAACRAGLEGIVCKRGDRPYRPGRGRDWLKLKCIRRQEFVIAGYTDPGGARTGFGALLLAVREAAGLRYAGRVGTGFDEALLGSLYPRLQQLAMAQSPFAAPLPREARKGVHFVRPVLVAEVGFADWTADGVLRHPVFYGLREDKAPAEVVAERPAPRIGRRPAPHVDGVVAGLRLSNPDRVLWPEQGITKRDLALYYEQMAQRLLPEVSNRPLTLFRCPEGRHNDCFFQKHADGRVPREIRRVPIEEKGERFDYTFVDTLGGVVGLAQMGVLEIHVWGARADNPERPDRLVFDLDPDEGLPWARVVDAARTVNARLAELGLTGFVRTTGGKGLHVVVPIARRHGWDEVKSFSQALALDIVRRAPRLYTASVVKRARTGKVFIDWLRNARGATAVASYTPRARPGAPVATPLRWEELTPTLRPEQFTVLTLPARLAGGDPWEGIDDRPRAITAAMRRELGMRGAFSARPGR